MSEIDCGQIPRPLSLTISDSINISIIFSSPELIFQAKRLKPMGWHNLAINNNEIMYTYYYLSKVTDGSGVFQYKINKDNLENVINLGKRWSGNTSSPYRYNNFGDYFFKELFRYNTTDFELIKRENDGSVKSLLLGNFGNTQFHEQKIYELLDIGQLA